MKPVLWRKAAERDAAEAAYWYATQGGIALGEKFLAAVEAGIDQISRHPGSGSLRHAMTLKLEGMRFWPIHDFPYLIFYIERDRQLDVWRVLHAQRDVPAWMEDHGKHL
ncbi:MAG TPA: type II toxin-antitoxin system RelE/ParE family toxin [Pseudoxanthomonas sp.]|nr:type II toxin-antitoxin system RelE/ParE family toxin [Pseudoxanthomonas sp.]